MENMIIYSLSQEFPEAEIWTERIDEGFSRPAFFIQRIMGVFTQEVGNRYVDTGSFAVHYFSDKAKQELNSDIRVIVEQLMAALKLISYKGETLHGYDINHRTEDGVLQFFVTYKRLIAVSSSNTEKMKKIGYKIGMED